MTDIEALYTYRLKQAQETLLDVERMLMEGFSSRSIISRAYYAMFYSLQALFLSQGTAAKTSRHSGIIALFDREFVHTDKLNSRYSKLLHKAFNARQEFDYKEFSVPSPEDALESVESAREFLQAIRDFIQSGDAC